VLRLGVVAFLNARPLIAGLENDPRIGLVFDVPAALPKRLAHREVDAALVPIIDLMRNADRWQIVSDACIGCDGETMTVRVFSQVPPERIEVLWIDGDSHTSVALAAILWRQQFGRELTLHPLDAARVPTRDLPAVLLIGDKVIDAARGRFAYEVDLGSAWRQHTGLPFVFAVWAVRKGVFAVTDDESDPANEQQNDASPEQPRSHCQRAVPFAAAGDQCVAPQRTASCDPRPTTCSELAALLNAARDRGLASAAHIAEHDGPPRGWPVELARRYLTGCLTFRLDERHKAGAELFARYCVAADLVPPLGELPWPPRHGLERRVVRP